MESTYDDVARTATLSSGQTIFSFHKSTLCQGQVCPVHNPSDHSLRSKKLSYNFTIGSFFRGDSESELMVDPDDFKLNTGGSVIVRNSAICHSCNTSLVSTTRHDYRSCICGKVFVDGGSVYIRHGWTYRDLYENTSIIVHRKDISIE